MLPYNKSKIVGANPFRVRSGLGGTVYGLAVTGIAEPAQATRGFTVGAYDIPLGPDTPATNIFRWKPCIAHVSAWPWAVDDIGVTFDQANLWAVRTRCCVAGLEGEGGDGGEVNWLTAVPKTLPAGFVFKGRSAIIGGLEADYLGDFPAYGLVGWDPLANAGSGEYFERGILWREPREIDGFGALSTHTNYQWAPCNLSRVSLAFGSQAAWYDTGSAIGDEVYTYGFVGEFAVFNPLKHLGWRGGRLPVAAAGSGPYAPAGSLTASVAYSDTITPATMADVTVVWSQDITAAATGDISIGACLAPTSSGPTAKKYWFFILKTIIVSGNMSTLAGDVKVSPRVDIPLWFTAITGNRVAPGGVLI